MWKWFFLILWKWNSSSQERCGVPTLDLTTVYCSLIRSAIKYASAVFANLPKYLSDALEGIQKRALRIILPSLHYDEALILGGLPSLEDRRAAACESFMRNLKPSNPVFGLAMSGRVTTVHSYSLRSCRNYNNKMCKTKKIVRICICEIFRFFFLRQMLIMCNLLTILQLLAARGSE